MRKEKQSERYPSITIRIPIDLNKRLRKCFKKRGELSKALVIIIKEAVDADDRRIKRIRQAILRQQADRIST